MEVYRIKIKGLSKMGAVAVTANKNYVSYLLKRDNTLYAERVVLDRKNKIA